MKSISVVASSFILGLWGVHAAPIKCVSGGKIIYTDNASLCDGAQVVKMDPANYPPQTSKSIPKGNQALGETQKPEAVQPKTSASAPSAPGPFGQVPIPEGVSTQDLSVGWKTVMEAKKRGTWQSPAIPEYAK